MELLEGYYVEEEVQQPAESAQPEEAAKFDPERILVAQREKFIAHLKEMKAHTAQMRTLVDGCKGKVTNNSAISDGLSILQVRNLTIAEYLMDLADFTQAKVAGDSVAEPVDRLLTNKCILEHLKPLERKLEYQLTKYKEIDAGKGSSLRANPAAMLVETEEAAEEEYMPEEYQAPRVAAHVYPKAVEEMEKENKYARGLKRKAKESQLIAEVAEDLMSTPQAVGRRAEEQKEMRQFLKRQKEIEEYEMEHFTRIPKSKKEKEMLKKLTKLDGSLDSIMNYERMNSNKD